MKFIKIKYIVLAFMLLVTECIFTTLKAQENNDWVNSDIITYRQFLHMEWDSLIDCGNRYLDNGIDYYYLQIRLGIAYHNKQRYVKAISHLNKALEFAPGDPVTIEYLYFANLFKGNDFEAKLWLKQITPVRRQELGIKTRFIDGYSADLTYSFTPEKQIAKIPGSTITGTQQLPKSFTNANVTLSQSPGSRFKLVEGYTFLYKNSMYYNKEAATDEINTNYILQNQLYISGILYPVKGLHLEASYHALFISVPTTATSNNGQGQQNKLTSFSTFSDYSYSLFALQSFGYFDIGYTYSGSKLNDYTQQQHTTNLGIYPLGNMNLYLLSRFIFLNDKTFPEVRSFILGETFGVKLSKHFWAEAAILAGNIQNMSDYGSYIIYNDVNPLKLKTGLNLLFPLSSGKIISIRSNYYNSESSFYDAGTKINTINYSSFSLVGGISWNF